MAEEYPNTEPLNLPTKVEEEYPIYIYPMGMLPGLVVSQDMIKRVEEAERKREENKKNKPPKPPRGRIARIGRLALGNT